MGQADQAIDGDGFINIGGLLGAPARRASNVELNGDAGRYVRTPGESEIQLNELLPPEPAIRVHAHELAHAIDDRAQYRDGIPTKGLSKELKRVYEDLNTGTWFKPGRGMTPQGMGYKHPDDVERELMAEAIRAYMRDPNYLKTVAPKTAARIREYVNPNPNLNKVIQFNSVGVGTVGDGLLNDDS